ncbi:hypothetical protein CsSME_00023683 [Camellia sinensis var. sinensis]
MRPPYVKGVILFLPSSSISPCESSRGRSRMKAYYVLEWKLQDGSTMAATIQLKEETTADQAFTLILEVYK